MHRGGAMASRQMLDASMQQVVGSVTSNTYNAPMGSVADKFILFTQPG